MSSDPVIPQSDALPDEPVDLDPQIEPEPDSGSEEDAAERSAGEDEPEAEHGNTLINPRNS